MTILPLDRVIRDGPGWYAGDFHCHTHHSDGVLTPQELLAVAREAGLDFFVITDHNTTAAFGEFGAPDDMLIIPGVEVTFDHGHFNVFGLGDNLPWAKPFCPGPTEIDLRTTDYDLGALVAEAANAGLLTSINHPLMPPWSWVDPDTDLAHVRCVEIWNDPSWPDSRIANPAAVALWTQWLNAGYRITALGGSDFHRPTPKAGSNRVPEQLGRPRTVVYAQALAGNAILEGVRQGRVYMTMGPAVGLQGQWQDRVLAIGDDLGAVAGELALTATVEAGYTGRAMLVRNGETVAECALTGGAAQLHHTATLNPTEPAWFRLDVHATHPATHPDRGDELLWAVTNPIYSGPAPTPTTRRYGDFVETPILHQAADRLQWPRLKSSRLKTSSPAAQVQPPAEQEN